MLSSAFRENALNVPYFWFSGTGLASGAVIQEGAAGGEEIAQ
jgi:hypothetical protein